MRARLVASLLIACSTAGTLHAATAYKCVNAKGAVAFQDHPCASDLRQTTLRLQDDSPTAPSVSAPTGDTADPDASTTPAAQAAATAQPPAVPPPPSSYICVRYDGSRYMSDTGQGGSALVPLGVLGVPGQSLADAYGGPNGIGVSAPGLRTIPHVPAGKVPFGGMDTWVDDQCHRASPREACAYLRNELDDVTSKLRRAFSDTEDALKQQQTSLQQRLRGC